MDNTEESVISLCSGYAGIERGLDLAGFKHRTIAYVEIEAFAIANLVAKMETNQLVPAPVWTNLKTFPMDKFRGRVDGITGGYPCQPFSCAGQRKGKDDPRHLWPHIRRIYQTIQPRWLFFENVEGHISLGLSTVISDLEEDGYRTTWGIFSAEEVGAPHRRKRVFILAQSKSREPWEQPEWKRREDTCRGSEKELDDPRRIGQAVGCLQTAGVEQSGEVLGDASSEGFSGNRQSEQYDNVQNAERGSCEGRKEELGDTEHDGLFAGKKQRGIGEAIPDSTKGKNSASESTGTNTPGELADSININAQREWADYNSERWQESNGQTGLCCGTKWPSNPGEPQHDWEEPRTVESVMGRTVDGTSQRVDRLRLLGNGVVPQTAAKAWITLNARLFGGSK